MKTYVFNVEMTCEGCSTAVTNVLNKHKGICYGRRKAYPLNEDSLLRLNIDQKGIKKFEVDLKKKTVEIVSSLNKEEVQEILKKTGKTVNLLEEK